LENALTADSLQQSNRQSFVNVRTDLRVRYEESFEGVNILNMLSKEQVQQCLNGALDTLYEKDIFLIEQDVNERSITHFLAVHLQAEIDPLENGWNVDCEYNRVGTQELGEEHIVKRLQLPPEGRTPSDSDTEAKTVFPDIIVHHRGEAGSEHNLLVIEVKKGPKVDPYDTLKLKGYVREFRYQYGAQLNLGLDHGNVSVSWLPKNGED